ncbi:MAG: KH domain-containing protein [Deltaproteobacteria bacterium]|nr:KH domain-containing protein [Deltaproteobacteria bacterium]
MTGKPLVELVEIVARALVDRPDQVKVRPGGGDRRQRIELSVAPDDVGKVIGKDGRTAQSIRVLLNTAAARLGLGRAYLDILD